MCKAKSMNVTLLAMAIQLPIPGSFDFMEAKQFMSIFPITLHKGNFKKTSMFLYFEIGNQFGRCKSNDIDEYGFAKSCNKA